ncbi:MAG: F0F1 ATP synthase subunit I [Kluyvera sp.]
MSMSLVSRNVARKLLSIQLLSIQLLAVVASGLLFSLKDPFWGISAVCGGLAVLLPNMLFMIFAWRHQVHTPAKGLVAWTFAFGEAFKVLAMLVLLIVALAVLKAVFTPLIVTWILVLVVQILAPAVINNKG